MTPQPPSRFGVFLPALIALALFFSGPFIILTPLPLLYAFLKHGKNGWKDAVIPALGAVLIIYATLLLPLHAFYAAHPQWQWLLPVPGMGFLDHLSAQTIIYFGSGTFLFFTFTGFFLAKILGQKKPSFYFLGWAAVVWTLIAVVFYLGACSFNNLDPYHAVYDPLLSSCRIKLEQLQQTQTLNLEQIAFVRGNLESFVGFYILVLPSVIFCSFLLIHALNLFLGIRLFSPFFFREPRMNWINEWRFSFRGVWLVIAGLALFLSSLYFVSSKYLTGFSVNLLIIMAFVYYLQGLVLVSFFLDKKNIGPLGRIAVYGILILLFQTVGLVLAVFGFADAWVDFRSRYEKINPKKQG